MTSAERNRRKRRLERAGFVYVEGGWFKPGFAKRIEAQAEAYRDEIEEALAEELPRGRPPKP